MWTLIKNSVASLAAFLGLQRSRQDALNTDRMQANERARQDAAIKDSANRAVAENDLDEIRKKAGE